MIYAIRKWIKARLCRWITIIEYCDDCGIRQPLVWWCGSNALWTEVTGEKFVKEPYFGGGCFCPKCFDNRAKMNGVAIRWIAQEEYRFDPVAAGYVKAGVKKQVVIT